MNHNDSELFSTISTATRHDDLESLIVGGAGLTSVLGHNDFQFELNMRQKFFNDYFQNPQILNELVRLFQTIEVSDQLDFDAQCKYAFLACQVLSANMNSIIEGLIQNYKIFASMFDVVKLNSTHYVTAQGYFYEIFKSLIHDYNDHKLDIIRLISENKEDLIYPMVSNLSAANAFSIKEVLVNQTTEMTSLKNDLFNHMVNYFLKDQAFEEQSLQMCDNAFENMTMILKSLISEKPELRLECINCSSLKNFFSPNSHAGNNSDYNFRLLLATYYASVNAIIGFENFENIIVQMGSFIDNKSNLITVKYIVDLFKILCANETFRKQIEPYFLKLIFQIITAYPMNDVLHFQCFSIIDLLLSTIEASIVLRPILICFLLEACKRQKGPKSSSKDLNKISLHFIAKPILKLHIERIEDQEEKIELQNLQADFREIFCLSDTQVSSNSLIDFSSIVKIIKQEELVPFTKNPNNFSSSNSNIWKDWSQDNLASLANQEFQETNIQNSGYLLPDINDVKMTKTHSVNLNNFDPSLIENYDDADYSSERFNIGSIEKLDVLSPEKGKNSLYSSETTPNIIMNETSATKNDSFAAITGKSPFLKTNSLEDSFRKISK
jgi:hypothetical protein